MTADPTVIRYVLAELYASGEDDLADWLLTSSEFSTFAEAKYRGPFKGKRGGIYWLPEGASDTAENRIYHNPNLDLPPLLTADDPDLMDLPELSPEDLASLGIGGPPDIDLDTPLSIPVDVEDDTPQVAPMNYPDGYSPPRSTCAPNPACPPESRPTLTADQARAITVYTDVSVFLPLTRMLRNGNSPAGGYARVAANIDAAMQRVPPFEKPVSVKRAITVDHSRVEEIARAAESAAAAGRPFQTLGFLSTTAGDNHGYNGNVRFKIEATHGLDAKPYSQFPGEDEMILPHVAQFMVLGVQRTTGSTGPNVTLRLRQIPPKDHNPTAEAKRPGLLTRIWDRVRGFSETLSDADDEALMWIRAMSATQPQPAETFAETARHVCFAEPLDGPDEFALAGSAGKRVGQLLRSAERHGRQVFYRLTERAVMRLLKDSDPLTAPVLFSDEELSQLRDSMATVMTSADLLGRSRVRRMADIVQRGHTAFAEDDPFSVFDDEIEAVRPEAAVDWFRARVPSLSIAADRYAPRVYRQASMIATAADESLLGRIKRAILDRLETGRGGTMVVQDILDAAGVTPRNPQYADMVTRTNLTTAYAEGQDAEMSTPDMQELFPAWEYHAIIDGRERPHHGARDGRLYPSSVRFLDVRGRDVSDAASCRCGHSPVSKFMLQGRRIETTW